MRFSTILRINWQWTTVSSIAVLLVVGSGTIGALKLRNGNTTPITDTPLAHQGPERRNVLEAQRITLRPTGFEPSEVTRPAGRFLLAINNRTGDTEASFTLLRATGERLREVRFRDTARKHEWREVVNLPPGEYVVTDPAHPEHVCRIRLTN